MCPKQLEQREQAAKASEKKAADALAAKDGELKTKVGELRSLQAKVEEVEKAKGLLAKEHDALKKVVAKKGQKGDCANCPNFDPKKVVKCHTCDLLLPNEQRYRKHCKEKRHMHKEKRHVQRLTRTLEALNLEPCAMSTIQEDGIGGSSREPTEVGAATPS